MVIEIFTIGFTQSTAENFFGRLKGAGVTRVLDIRLHNDSQLAAFAKASDLPYFLRELIGAEYEHDLRLAPDEDLLAAVRKEAHPLHRIRRPLPGPHDCTKRAGGPRPGCIRGRTHRASLQ